VRKLIWLLAALALAGAAGLFLTAPKRLDPTALAGLVPDVAQGEQVFIAAGCASCHAAPDATRATRLILAGGVAFPSDFGTFYAPNISPDPDAGIGAWSALDLANAMLNGTSPDRQHYYPAFPYGSYGRASLQDIVSLRAYLQTLPPSPAQNRPHDVGFPFNIRASLGGWKLLFQNTDWMLSEARTPEIERGRYLVEALGHCAECHTPRNVLGGLKTAAWLSGAPNPNGRGTIPNITPAKLNWSDNDLLNYFKTGFTPDFDTVGGQMAEVVENLAQLPEDDLRAIILPTCARSRRWSEIGDKWATIPHAPDHDPGSAFDQEVPARGAGRPVFHVAYNCLKLSAMLPDANGRPRHERQIPLYGRTGRHRQSDCR